MTGKAKWEVPSDIPRFSGVLSTAGGVVFSGQLTGEFEAFDADNGKKLWQFQTGSGIEGQPVTWQQDGVQYVAVTSGYGGVYSLFSGDERLAKVPTGGSLWVFAVKNRNRRLASDQATFRTGRRRISPPSRSTATAQMATHPADGATKCRRRSGADRPGQGDLRREMLALPRPRHGECRHDHARSAQVSRRQGALLHHGEERQERQDAALGRPPERRPDRVRCGPMFRARGNHENLAFGVRSGGCC